MKTEEIKEHPELVLRPAAVYAFLQVVPLLTAAIVFLWIAWWLSSLFIWLSLIMMLLVWYKFMHIRKVLYIITPEVIRIRTGIFSKRIDSLKMYRIKDYVITQPFILQLCRLMNLTLKTTDAENESVVFSGIPVSGILDTIRDYVQTARLTNRVYEIN
jgi:uncharacterized membrane protein YdbT with pleckstrin-like domain